MSRVKTKVCLLPDRSIVHDNYNRNLYHIILSGFGIDIMIKLKFKVSVVVIIQL